MIKIIVAGKSYYTNITDINLIHKCKRFFSDGCSSYAISFDNESEDIIKSVKIEGFPANYLRKMNFEKCFLPASAAMLNDSKQVLQKGLDLIELL